MAKPSLLATFGMALLAPGLALSQTLQTKTGAQAAMPCEQLAELSLPLTTIVRAESLAAGKHPEPVGEVAKSVCRVVATVGPARIALEIWLPTEGWNGKFQGIGNGGLAGTIAYANIRAALARGYAAAATDTGHTCATTACNPEPGTDLTWFTDEQKIVDYAYRAIHEMTVKGKTVTQAFYGLPPRVAYFNGCSTGGGQGLINISRYPGDYDGILSGAPAYMQTRGRMGLLSIWQAANKNPEASFPASKLAVIHQAVLAKCDAKDGVADGIMEDPRTCNWRPAELLCKPGQDVSGCLTAPQVEAVDRIYSPLRTSDTGEPIGPAWVRGSELNGWETLVLGDLPRGTAINFFRYMVYHQPEWNPRAFAFTAAEVAAVEGRRIALTDESFVQALTAGSSDIGAFTARGGKVLMYHGWGDADVTPMGTVDLYERMTRLYAGRDQDIGTSARLFMVPGMAHCRGGAGATDTFDGMAALEDWVERGIAPERIIAAGVSGPSARKTRPLCAYPQVARWSGTGSSDEAANFTCVKPQ